MTCAFHPRIETTLRCASCDRPICFSCQVVTPVGIKCRECAAPVGAARRHSKPLHYVRAAGSGVIVAVGAGIGYAQVTAFLPLIPLILGLAIGYLIAQAILWGSYRARGRPYQLIGVGCVLVAFAVVTLAGGSFLLEVFFAGLIAWFRLA